MSWKEIAEYLGRDVRTVVRWEKDKGLPVHRVPGGKRQAVYAYSYELDRWLRGEPEAAASPVEEVDGSAAAVAPALSPQRRIRRAEWALLIAIALVCFSLLGFLFRPQVQPNEPLRLVRLNTESGIVGWADLSPDGRQVAYTFRRTGETVWHVYLQLIGAGDPVRLTHTDDSEGRPSWSPDGRFLAFPIIAGEAESIVIVPALGGTPRVVARVHDRHSMTYVSWMPDGKGLVYPDRDSENEPISTWIVRLDSGERTRFFTAPSLFTHDYHGAFSPDGSFFAFVRAEHMYPGAVMVMPAGGGEARKLADEVGGTLSWTADSRDIVYEHFETGNVSSLYRVTVSNGQQRLVSGGVHIMYSPSIAHVGRGMVLVEHQNDSNIWRLDLSKPRPAKLAVADSPDRDVDPACSPNNQRLAFLSYRKGADLWVADADGGNPKRLTYIAESALRNSGTPDWSPDQHSIAFSVSRGTQTDIAVIDVASGDVRHLTTHPAIDVFPRWSRDGNSIYFTSDRSGRFEIWKMQADGGSPIRITQNGGYLGHESFDGKYVYFGKYDAAGIWRMPVDGGSEELVVPELPARYAWSLSRSGIFFIQGTTSPGMTIHFYDFATRRTSHVYEPPEMLEYQSAKLSACPDGKKLFISQSDVVRSDLIWAENFK